MKLKKIRISYMDHPQVLSFYDDVITYLTTIDHTAFAGLFDRFRNSVEQLRKSFRIYHRNVLVKQIDLEQRNLQHNLMSIRYRLKKNLESAEPAIVALSQKAVIVLEYYYSSKHISVHQKDDKIFNIVDAMEDFLTERERQNIGIATYLKNLKRINEYMRALMEKRDSIPITETVHNLIQDRQHADNLYREMICFLNLHICKYHNEMMNSLNELITSRAEMINTRLIRTEKVHSVAGQNIGVA